MTTPLEVLALNQLRRRSSLKWQEYPPDVLPLWVAEMDVPLALPVVDAVTQAVALGDTGYPAGTAYAEAYASFAARRWGWGGVEVPRTVAVADVMSGVRELLALLTGPGDAVVLTNPVYPPFWAAVLESGREVVTAPLTQAGRLDLQTLSDACARAGTGGRRAVLLLANPHNPTGAVHTRAELEAVAALARAAGVRVVADEIHAPLVLAGATFTPFLSVPGSDDGFVVVSASKAWSLAALKSALVLAGPEAAEDLARLPSLVLHGPSHLGLLAQTAAWAYGDTWLDDLLDGLAANRALLGRLLAAGLPKVAWTPPEATYLAWLDCTGLGLGEDPAAVFLERGRVALSPGPTFGAGGEGHARLNFACSAAVLEEAVARLGAAVPDEADQGPGCADDVV